MDELLLTAIVAARVLIPLAIPRFPLPAMILSLVIDGVDQSIFSAIGDVDLEGYQTYDKALDVYYLSIAYTASLRNWTNLDAFRVGRFLYHFRLVGVVLFELTQVRAILLVFPNVFEYFFDAYAAVRVRWDPRRLGPRLVIGIAAFIWIVIKLPQEWWIHVAQLDATDVLKDVVFGVPADAGWGDALANRPIVTVALGTGIIAVALAVRWFVRHRLPPADRRPTFDANEIVPTPDHMAVDRERRRLAARLIDRELVEKIALVTLISVIFARMLPDFDSAPREIAVGVGLIIVANAAISEWFVRRGRVRFTIVRQFVLMLTTNLAVVLVGGFVAGATATGGSSYTLLFVGLLTLIVTLYDQYRPIYLARFA